MAEPATTSLRLPDSASTRLPAPLRGAIALLFAEATILAAMVGWLVYADLTADADVQLRGALIVTGYGAMMTGVLLALAVALRRRRSWARGPAIVLQLLLVPVGCYMIVGGLAVLGVPVVLVGLVGAGGLLAPITRAALGQQ